VLFEGTTSQEFSWSPDGKAIALTDRDALWIVTPGGGTTRRIAPAGLSLTGEPLWDRQGRSVVCQSGPDLIELDPSTSHAQTITSGLPGIKSDPQWSADGTLWFKTADPETGRQGVASVVSGSRPVQRFLEDAELRQVAPCAGGLCFTLQTIATPENIWRIEPTTGRREQLTDTNAQTREMSFGTARLMRWQGAEGEQLKGVLLLPAGYREGARYPVVVWVYETFSSSLHVFKLHLYNLQVLANSGYAVLMPDVQFSLGETARSYESCVLPALDKLVEAGIANGRFGLMGHSFGGFATNILVTRSDRFKAAVAIAGISDWVSFSGYPGDFMRRSHEQGQGRLGGPLWDDPRRYSENSPVFHLDKVATPLLIIHGMEDLGVPFQQAEAMYYGLRRLRKTATLVAYPGEDHLHWNTQRAVLRDMWNRILSWFELHLADR
jgi:dipeptidyl aminopeptidase/acylaminoacyl peptidase